MNAFRNMPVARKFSFTLGVQCLLCLLLLRATDLLCAVARKDLKGQSGPGWHPEQALSREEALRLFTSAAAYARFAERDLGTIAVGKRADLTAFSVDLMTAPEADIPKGHAVLTMVDGQVVWQAP